MPKLSANISMLFLEMDFLDRFKAASDFGFRAVEYLFPYDHKASDLAELLERYNLEQALFNFPAGDWQNGERGIACLSGRSVEFREGVDKALEYAKTLGCTNLNILAGRVVDIQYEQREHFIGHLVDNVKWSAKKAASLGINVLIEALNTEDTPGFLLGSTKDVIEVIDKVDEENVFVQYDAYHMQIMEGNLANNIEKYINRVGHIQIADNPGRHEPGTGEINFDFLLEHLDRLNYEFYVGCEYAPLKDTASSLKWAKKYLTKV